MKLENFSPETQHGLIRWAIWEHNDDLLFDAIASTPEAWAWIYFQLYVAENRSEWFPKGKSATLQFLHQRLSEQAKREGKT
jgi:hypothetical protein